MRAQPARQFLFGLALRLGMTVSQLLASLDSPELTEWMAFFALERERDGGHVPEQDVEAQLMKVFGKPNG